MGLIDNIRRILDGQRYKNRERVLEREVAQATIDDSTFYREYGSFTTGLEELLDAVLIQENQKEIIIKPNFPQNAKYFRAVMEDDYFTSMYHIEKTSGGEFRFILKTIDFDSIEEELN